MECCNDEMMKDMKKLMILVVMVAAFVLPTMAQFGQQDPNQVQFQSTSTMTGSGSTYAPNPSLNSTGTANAPSFGGETPGGPNRAPDPISTTDDERFDEGLNTPLGDAILPLMLMALAYAVYSAMRVYRRTRRV